ncbi:lysylphosphatidylglycerol synthase transmembrane domain-containing protein [Leptolyngbya sp. AN02str]|uniref:lysylphosphatidylglycerol synthase transmembrane domain-containing protein n=1 Tax=Leptolyngbya sp. AN02str TaxID=3423363 RepID=UPI003D30F4A7
MESPTPLPKKRSPFKSFLRWAIVGGTLFFLAKAFKDNWQEVAAIRIDAAGWGLLVIALITTLLAHLWSGWVWGWILRELGQRVAGWWSTQVYLTTNIAKYLPGNVWHFYGRVTAAKANGVSLGAAILSVVLESLLMAAAALMVAIIGVRQAGWGLQVLALAIALIAIHPKVLNPVLQRLSRSKAKGQFEMDESTSMALRRYPVVPLLGELGFFVLRGAGFLWIVAALHSLSAANVLPVLGGFSVAWLLGLVVPGAPGGLGVFEATAIALLPDEMTPAVILSTVALYRLINTLAEAVGAAIGMGIRSVLGKR